MLTTAPTATQPRAPRSLAISPNLDALLEHEERARGGVLSHTRARSSPVNIIGELNFPVALPPPPRGNRRPKWSSALGPDIEGFLGPTSFNALCTNGGTQRSVERLKGTSIISSNKNPYINPAPTSEGLVHVKRLKKVQEMVVGETGEELRGNYEKCLEESNKIEVSGKRPRPSYMVASRERRPHATSQQSYSRAVCLVVDGPLSRCKNTVDLFSDDLSKETGLDCHQESLSFLPRPTRRPKRKVEPPRANTSGPMAYAVDDSSVLDIRRQHSVEFIDITHDTRHDAWRHRPFDSHAPSRRASEDSIGSGSTIGPSIKQRRSTAHNSNLLEATDSDKQSFIDFFSPTTPRFNIPTLPPLDTSDMLLTRASGIRGDSTSSETQASPSHSSEPSTPKPTFSLPALFISSQAKPRSRSGSPHQHISDRREKPPPTTNFLNMGERADLVKRSRKLTRMFGETPGGDMLSLRDSLYAANGVVDSGDKRPKKGSPRSRRALDSEQLQYLQNTGRRHSIPVTPDELSESFDQILFGSIPYKATLGQGADPSSHHPGKSTDDFDKTSSRVSFIDLSDEEDGIDEALSPIAFAPNPNGIGSHRVPSPSQLSLYEAMTPEQRAEEEKRRNREKLAKLHRFLGSRVPAELVLGTARLESSLPPIQLDTMPLEETENRKQWLRRRRSSSAGALPSWSDDVDRMKEELNGKEKAINVRRAQKMEKLFGVAPPQTLYHTRHSPSPSLPPGAYSKRSKSPKPSFGGFIPPGEVPSPTYQQRNPNRSSYIKQKPKKNDRPSTAESSLRLLPEGQDCYNYDESPAPHQGGARTSLVYRHYHHSLKSLNDILDRDDKESLAELHQYLNDYEDTNANVLPLSSTPSTKDRRLSNASSIKSERRRSLPARTSMLSIASEYSITSPKPEVSDFQIRRRRAAKLAQFFGVNYRELINDVLESLEAGLEHERRRGTLRAEELEDLLERLRKIKSNRQGLF